MKHPRIYRFLCLAQKASKRHSCAAFAARVGLTERRFVEKVLPANGWAIPVAALPLIALTVYRTGYFTGVRHQGGLLTALFVLFTLVFVVLYIALGGCFRYWSLTYFLKLEKLKRARRAAAAEGQAQP
jgi:hypothetical protein